VKMESGLLNVAPRPTLGLALARRALGWKTARVGGQRVGSRVFSKRIGEA
jgi:hypothetical protein